jgi:hypothetical protein
MNITRPARADIYIALLSIVSYHFKHEPKEISGGFSASTLINNLINSSSLAKLD